MFGEVPGTEDVTDVDRHDDGRVMEVEWMIGESFWYLKHLYAG